MTDNQSMSEPSVFDQLPEPEETGFIPVPGGAVWYRINGRRHFARGKTALLCLHTGPGSSHHYLLPLTMLADNRPVILFDQLDCGLSQHPGRGENWKSERFVNEIDAIRNHLGLSEVALYGHSRGATWAGLYAIRRPPGLRAAILASPFFSGPLFARDALRLLGELPAAVRETLASSEQAGTTHSPQYQQALEFWSDRHLCRRSPWPQCLQRSADLLSEDLYRHMWGPSELKCGGQLSSFDMVPHLGKINVPVWYVCGEHDHMTPDTVTQFARLTPGSQIDVIADAAHMPHLDDPRLFTILAGDFLERATGRSGVKTLSP